MILVTADTTVLVIDDSIKTVELINDQILTEMKLKC